MNFTERLGILQSRKNSLLCVGLDPVLERLPISLRGKDPLLATSEFCRSIIDSTLPEAIAFKPNLAFFEALGPGGMDVLLDVTRHIGDRALTIADGKRGDIGNTAAMYARSFFEEFNFDSCTVSAYMGRDSVDPFLSYEGKLVFVLVKTSNQGAEDFQNLQSNGKAIYQIVAEKVEEWGMASTGETGFVVGATQGNTLSQLRLTHKTTPFLVPGIGAQGGSIEDTLAAHTTKGSVLINSSRSIIYASSGEDYSEQAALAAAKLNSKISDELINSSIL